MKEITEEMRRRIELFDFLAERSAGFAHMDQKTREVVAKKFLRGECLVLRERPEGTVIYSAKAKKNPPGDTTNGDKTNPF